MRLPKKRLPPRLRRIAGFTILGNVPLWIVVWNIYQVPGWLTDQAYNANRWKAICAKAWLAMGGLYGPSPVAILIVLGLFLVTVDLWGPSLFRTVGHWIGRHPGPSEPSKVEVFGRECPLPIARAIRGLQAKRALETFEYYAPKMSEGMKTSTTGRLLGKYPIIDSDLGVAVPTFVDLKLAIEMELETAPNFGAENFDDERRFTRLELTQLGKEVATWLKTRSWSEVVGELKKANRPPTSD